MKSEVKPAVHMVEIAGVQAAWAFGVQVDICEAPGQPTVFIVSFLLTRDGKTTTRLLLSAEAVAVVTRKLQEALREAGCPTDPSTN